MSAYFITATVTLSHPTYHWQYFPRSFKDTDKWQTDKDGTPEKLCLLANTQQASFNPAATGVPEGPPAETMAFPYPEPKAKLNVLNQEHGGSECTSQLPAMRIAWNAFRPPREDNRSSPISTLHASEEASSYPTRSLCVNVYLHVPVCG